MGDGEFGNSLNGGLRDIIGLMDAAMIATVSAYGTKRVTVNPFFTRRIPLVRQGKVTPVLPRDPAMGRAVDMQGRFAG